MMKTKLTKPNWERPTCFLVLCLALFALNGCQDDSNEKPITVTKDVEGHVQKGPFIIGTSITAAELSSSLDQTGKSFTTQITDNSGLFEFSGLSLTSNFVELSSTGFYFDEVKGSISLAPLNLHSLSDATDVSSINVNILTHLEKPRVEFLVHHNYSFSEAKKIAQAEVLGIFGIANDNMNNSEALDITSDSEGNAALLAISVILQGERNVGDLSELLANISNNIREDGALNSDSLVANLRASAKDLHLSEIRLNLEKRYNDLSIDATIPNFEKYVKRFLELTGKKPVVLSTQSSGIEAKGVTLAAGIIANSLTTSVSFEYGITTDYGQQVTPDSTSGDGVETIIAALSNLSPGTTYHWRVVAVNAKGTTTSADNAFRTLGQVPTVTTLAASDVFSTGGVLNGTVTANYLPTTVIIEYGTSTSYGQSAPALQGTLEGIAATRVNAAIDGLISGTLYHFRIKASNELGDAVSDDQVFTPDFTIGGKELGGIVAYLLQSGDAGYISGEKHGLVVAGKSQTEGMYYPNDEGEGVQWYNGSDIETGATATAVGSGMTNTLAIINAQGNTGVYAAKLCRDYRGGGYDDWYLPSQDELDRIYQNKVAIGGLAGWFWTSTETKTFEFPSGPVRYACYQQLTDGHRLWFPKDYGFKVRAVRSF